MQGTDGGESPMQARGCCRYTYLFLLYSVGEHALSRVISRWIESSARRRMIPNCKLSKMAEGGTADPQDSAFRDRMTSKSSRPAGVCWGGRAPFEQSTRRPAHSAGVPSNDGELQLLTRPLATSQRHGQRDPVWECGRRWCGRVRRSGKSCDPWACTVSGL